MSASVQHLVNREILRWQAEQSARPQSQHEEPPASNIITLSNQLGSQGHAVARRVGEALGIPVYDREIVEHIATDQHVRVLTVETLDQRAFGRIDDYMINLFRERNFDQSDYMQALVRTVLALWHHGPCLLIGRGANQIVPRDHALSVRTVASLDDRARVVRQREESENDAAALRRIQRIDAERNAFTHHYFGYNIDDAGVYDMVLNTSYMPVQVAADVLVAAYRRKFDGKGVPTRPL